MNTDYWFPKVLAPRLLAALEGRHFISLRLTYTVHEDGDKAMLEMHFGAGTGDSHVQAARRMLVHFVMGFEAASAAKFTLPQYVVGHEGRSGYRLDQTNRISGIPTPRRFNSVVSLPSSAIKGDAEAAIAAAYDGIHQFCKLNGLTYPEVKQD
jgi:hypothetical protein